MMSRLFSFFITLLLVASYATFSLAIPDGAGNDVFPSSNVGIGTKTPQGAFVVTNGNVGIGTWAPNTAFTVRNGNVGIGSDIVSHAKLEIVGDGASELLRVNDSGLNDTTPFIVQSNGNIGIGTSSPSYHLDLVGGESGYSITARLRTSANNLFRIESSTTAAVGVWFASSVAEYMLVDSAQGSLNVIPQGNINAAASFSLRGTNLGIGTQDASVQSKLVVVGGNVGIGTWTAAGGNLIVNGGGNVGIGTAWPGTTLDVAGSIRSSGAVTAANTGDSYFLGNVGVGTMIPPNALYVAGTAEMTGFKLDGNGAAAGYVMQTNSVGVGTWVAASTLATSGGGSSSQWFTASGVGIGTYDKVGLGTSLTGQTAKLAIVGGNVGIGTVDAQGALVVTNGNVGIGTWDARSSIEVVGTAAGSSASLFRLTNLSASTGTEADIVFTLATAFGDTGKIGMIRTNQPNNADTDFIIAPRFNGVTTESLRVTSSGNIGIGTSLPVNKLAIVGNIGIGTIIYSSYLTTSASNGGMIVEGNVGIGTTIPQAKFVTIGNVGIGTWTAAGGNLIVNGGGNVGIGTAWPGTTLDVNGNIRASNSGDSYFLGNVGMGTTIPPNALYVAGTAEMTGFKLDGNGAAAGYVMQTNSVGVGTWVAASTLATSGGGSSSQWFTASGVGIGTYDKVGLGTSLTGQTARLAIVGGNVGIGTVDAQGALVVTNGNVGIGTWAPRSALNVMNGNVGIGTTLSTYSINVGGSAPQISFVDASNNRGLLVGVGDGFNGILNTVGSGNLQLQTSGTTRMIIGTNGGLVTAFPTLNVGIGTTIAINKLDLAGNMSIGTLYAGYQSAPSYGLIVQGNVGVGTFSPQAGFVSLNNVGIGTWTAAGGNLIVNGGGNVGIGTAWPGVALDVSGSIRSTGTMTAANSGDSYFLGNLGVGTSLPVSSLDLRGSMGVSVVSKSSAYTATASDYMILVSASGGAVTITLPAASGVSGRVYVIKKTDATANAVTIDPNASETVDGQLTQSITTQYGSLTIVCDGSNWWVI